MDRPQTSATHAITVEQPCQAATVLGGYQVDPTVVAKDVNGLQLIHSDLLPVSAFETSTGDPVVSSSFRLVSAASNASTPSVETYVLNASFLI
jgi:hypothetical protein